MNILDKRGLNLAEGYLLPIFCTFLLLSFENKFQKYPISYDSTPASRFASQKYIHHVSTEKENLFPSERVG